MTVQPPVYRCQKRPTDFFSYALGQINNAKKACLGITEAGQPPCPILMACRNYARRNGEWGIWGGETEEERRAAGYPPRYKLYSEIHGNELDPLNKDPSEAPDLDVPAAAEPKAKRPRKKRRSNRAVQPHGTKAAVLRHRRAKEKCCELCAPIERQEAEKYRRAKGRKPKAELSPCGTRPAAQRHRRRKEVICEPCRLADAAWHRENNARKRREEAERLAQATTG